MSDSECLSCGSLAVRYCEQCYRALKITSRLLSNALITADADAELELAQKIATIEAQEQ